MSSPSEIVHGVINSLFAALKAGTSLPHPAESETSTASSPKLSDLLESAGLKPMLLTLHCLFPHAFLPALDILDRRLAVRIGTGPSSLHRGVYYVRSSQQARRRGGARGRTDAEPTTLDGTNDTSREGTHYEVRLRAWSCTCAAFAFAALESDDNDSGASGMDQDSADGAAFGGVRSAATVVPACRHILACFLLETWPVVRGWCVSIENGTDGQAGWAAGWR